MLVRMSKYAFMVYHREYDDFLIKLRDLGVVHVKGNGSLADNENAQLILQQRRRINETLKALDEINANEENLVLADSRPAAQKECFRILDSIDALRQQKIEMLNQLSAIEKDIAYLESTWGKFSYPLLNKINDAGYDIHFFTCPVSEFNEEWDTQYDLIRIKLVQSHCYFVIISHKDQPVKISAERSRLPKRDVNESKEEHEYISVRLALVEEELAQLAAKHYNTLVEVEKELQDEFNMDYVVSQTTSEADNKLMLLEGWLPDQKSKALEQAFDKDGYYYQRLAIDANDLVPVELRNNKFAKLYEPICKMFSLPNYREFDPTPFFAPFFMLFFGMCFADGGYGLLMLLTCTVLKGRVNPDYRPYLTLFQYLGTAALFVGIVSGSFFGISLIELPAFATVKDYFLTSDNIMTISLVIGIIHILFGKTVAALKKMSQRGTKFGIAPLAWVFAIASTVLAFGLPELDIHLSETTTNVLLGIAGLSLLPALFYNSPGKNIFLNFGSGLWNTYNVISGLLGDTLSYIRLFAIGLTGAILGGVFNSLAVQMTDGMSIIPKILLMTIILLFGHTLNFGLCTISSLVHPLRLIFVEYYKNAEFEGGGHAYEPFKKA